jgi:tRNA threonylcarbamoyladenosine biosynthesis protein TsaE
LDTFAFETDSPEETFARGTRLGEVLTPMDFVGLSGQIAAGKTLFARGVAMGAGVAVEDVSSPTYAIVQTYSGRMVLHHADFYRVVSKEDLYGTGFFELTEAGGATVVEWLERVPSAAPADALYVRIEVLTPQRRAFEVRATGPRAAALRHRWFTGSAAR